MIRPMPHQTGDSNPTRSSLLGRLRNTQDHASWEEFYAVYSKLVLGFSLKAGLTESEAQEVVQETMIAAAKHLPQFRYDPTVCSFRTWLLNVSAWRVQDQLRKRQRPGAPGTPSAPAAESPSRTATIERVPDPATTQLEAIWDKEWKTALLDTATATVKVRVDPTHWQIFDLSVLKEWSVADVAETLGVSAARVYLAKHRISTLIKKELKRLQKSNPS